MNVYRVLADAVVVVHAGYVAAVVAGLLLVLAGIVRRWSWIRNFWFRLLHLAMIGIVVVQSLLGTTCPLTTLENYWRTLGGGRPYPDSFLGYWAHRLIFCDAPPWVFTLGYCLFGAVVAATWIMAPPRWPRSEPPTPTV